MVKRVDRLGKNWRLSVCFWGGADSCHQSGGGGGKREMGHVPEKKIGQKTYVMTGVQTRKKKPNHKTKKKRHRTIAGY